MKIGNYGIVIGRHVEIYLLFLIGGKVRGMGGKGRFILISRKG